MMVAEKLSIRYRFQFADGRTTEMEFSFDAQQFTIVNDDAGDGCPDWVLLSHHKCSHCPLSGGPSARCPAAEAIAGVIDLFDGVVSHDTVRVEVSTDERTVTHAAPAQKVAGSVLGLLLPASGCPHTAFFRPMARYHLPLSTREETLFRAVSIYLIAQFIAHQEGREPDCSLSGLENVYEGVQRVNSGLARRLRDSMRTDSPVNAIVMLDALAKSVAFDLDDTIADLKVMFGTYFSSLG